ncbi:MAG: SCO family protein [Chloroflexota bacterium]|nr:SCO family protein [Chloroflexota bacterium]
MLPTQTLDRHTPEDTIAELADAVRQSPERRDLLLELLPERLALYEGRSTNETIRIRGYILAAFEQTGLPEAALPYVLEELQSGRDAYLVAGAAKALRGLETPGRHVVPFLLKAVENIKNMDDALTFDSYKPNWPIENYTTALAEIFKTLGWLGGHAKSALPSLETFRGERRGEFSRNIQAEIESAINRIRADEQVDHDCCSPVPQSAVITFHNPRERLKRSHSIKSIELEDQDGDRLTYGEFFSGKPSIVVFFYTRCNNPDKCSLTITKLGRLQGAMAEAGLEGQLKTAAITYDPEYDLPPRLKAYGENRGVSFSDDHRVLRTRSRFHELRAYFQLGVNFSPATVNRHTIELFILDSQGGVAATFSRLQWDVQEVLEQAKALLKPASSAR